MFLAIDRYVIAGSDFEKYGKLMHTVDNEDLKIQLKKLD